MPVVINDFEVVSETTPGGGGGATRSAPSESEGGGQGGAGASAPGLTPNDIRRVLRHELERTERVHAH